MCCASFCICLYIFYTFVFLGCENYFSIQLFRERLSKKNVHATIPEGNIGYDQYSLLTTVVVEPTFVAFL